MKADAAFRAELMKRIRTQEAGSVVVNTMIPNVEAEIDALFAVVHSPSGSLIEGQCSSCGQTWPCGVFRSTAAKYHMTSFG